MAARRSTPSTGVHNLSLSVGMVVDTESACEFTYIPPPIDERRPIGSSTFAVQSNGVHSLMDPKDCIYYEVLIKDLPTPSSLVLGYSKRYFQKYNVMPGGIVPDSFGYSSGNGHIECKAKTLLHADAFAAGDTVGCGILIDTYAQRRMFWTKNGSVVGIIENRLSDGMDFVPTVGFDGPVTLSFNFGQRPFSYKIVEEEMIPAKAIIGPCYIDMVPNDIINVIIDLCTPTPFVALAGLGSVNKAFATKINRNEIWKRLYLDKWPNQNKKLRIKDWKKFYKRRHELFVKDTLYKPKEKTIENCEMEFTCPLRWELLDITGSDTERFCNNCNKTVYAVKTAKQLEESIAVGRCVAIVPEDRKIRMMGRAHTSFRAAQQNAKRG